jgi:glutaminase
VLGLATPSSAQSPAEIQQAVDAAYGKFRTLNEGKNADYIPALAKVDPNLFGIALITTDGRVYTAGDVKTEVSIQSISKVFTMAQVIQEQGAARLSSASASMPRAHGSTRLSRLKPSGPSPGPERRR